MDNVAENAGTPRPPPPSATQNETVFPFSLNYI